MNYETVERCGRIHVVKNGVESECFAIASYGDHQLVYCPGLQAQTDSLEKALEFIASGMDNWHTVAEAAVRLVELGKADTPPVTQTMYRWLRRGRFPGAIKVPAAGPGRGGPWRIPEKALREFTKRGGEKK